MELKSFLPQSWWKPFANIFYSPAIPKLHPLLKQTKERFEYSLEEFEELDREEVRILTLNLFMRPPGVKNNDDDFKEERFEEYLKLLDNYDIICNQELFTGLNSRKERFISHAKKLGFIDHVVSTKPKLFEHFVIDSGLCIVSRFPIIKTAEMTYSRYAYSDSMSQKGALYARIKIGKSTLHLFNTHLQANYLHSDYTTYSYSIDYRDHHQLQELSDFIDEQLADADDNCKIMIVGDFNISSRPFSEATIEGLRELSKTYPEYKKMLDEDYDQLGEYKHLMNMLSKDGKYTVINLKKGLDQEGETLDVVTFGDYIQNEDGSRSPAEVALTHRSDSMVATSIDYIFQLTKNQQDVSGDCSKVKLIKKDPTMVSDREERDSKKFEDKLSFWKQFEGIYDGQELFINPTSLKQEKFLIEGREFTQMSDHYGLSVEVEWRGNKYS
ncbi:unnamed protein product [Moneuplotes crassus]|uniref:sphingomyelin phosphodiesterase n=1 Tax=Euplotes crassus TaxID=5936 RepID=A0AAD1XFK0_EUPCR|nr:unnamed protein product [Moneuplotes crassus]